MPQFRGDADRALDVARRAEAAGVDGVFLFDHLWPLGRPERPALHGPTLAGAVAGETERVVLGTLVARVGLLPNEVLVHTFVSLRRMVGEERLIAGLGTGDQANRDENRAYGIPFPPPPERVAALAACLRALGQEGVRTWVGGQSPAVLRAAAGADGWNGWGLSPHALAERASALPPSVERTWAGQVLVGWDERHLEEKRQRFGERPGVVTGTVRDLARHLRALGALGVTWAVCAPLDVASDRAAPDAVAAAAALANVDR